ncbi:MAG: hypothetical protein ACE5GK_08275 [Nitrospiria bacterium]
MGVVVREADLHRDQAVLIKTLNENRSHTTDTHRYRWRYLDNPHGQAKAWLAIDDKNGTVAGFTVAHPRVMSVEGKAVVCWNCGDFSIHKKYRTLGVAVKLRSAATQCINRGDPPFLYAHPNDRMTLIHLKVGHKTLGQMVRYARPIGLDRFLPKLLQGTPVSSGLRRTYHRGLSMLKGASRFRLPFDCRVVEGFWEDAPYEDLMAMAKKEWKIVGRRDGSYLKWRFGEQPSQKISTLLLFKKNKLVAYAFFSLQDRVMHVHDLFSLPEDRVFNGLVAHITEAAYDYKAETVSIVLLESNPLIPSLLRNGYLLRPERSNVMVHVFPGFTSGHVIVDEENWFMTVGDRDV